MPRTKRACVEVSFRNRMQWQVPTVEPACCTGCSFYSYESKVRQCEIRRELGCDDPDVIFIEPSEEAFNDYIAARTSYRLRTPMGEDV